MKRNLQVMKFGGTSVGNSSSIRRVVEIIRTAARESSIVVVVSAMSGVTNQLIEAATQSKAGHEDVVREVFARLQKQHSQAVSDLIGSDAERCRLQSELDGLFAEGHRLCQGTLLLRELTPRTLDAISGLGERLCAPLVAAALAEVAVTSEAIDASELIVTDSYHGGAEPWIDLTRLRCEARVLPCLKQGVVPVVTGFIGATEDHILTTLGRGGSDYSATILGAALDADEVVIWTDVQGLLTADPRLVPEASTIPEISYREAAELAYFGAKVLHPKTLRPVLQRGIPIWIRNTFAPAEHGTKITPHGAANAYGARALTAISDAALITITGQCAQGVPDALARTVATVGVIRADVLLISQSSPQNDICLVIPAPLAKRTVEALRHEFSSDLMHEKVEHNIFDAAVSVITLVGKGMRSASGTVVRTFAALGQEDINIIATVQGSSDCSMSFVVPQDQVKTAVASIHRELALESPHLSKHPAAVSRPSSAWGYQPEQASAD